MTSILVTGAGGGIGGELVSVLVQSGYRVFAAKRQRDLAPAPSGTLTWLCMDVADDGSVALGFAEIDRLLAGAQLDAVVHCAAIAPLGAVEVLANEAFAEVFNTNTMGSLRVIRASIPRLRGHGGRLILVTSLWGRVAGPMVGAYAASKFAVEALADSVRRETAHMDLRVIVVEPGVVRTSMLDQQLSGSRALVEGLSELDDERYGRLYRRYAALVEKGAKGAISATEAARQIVKIIAARSPRRRYRVGQDAKLMCALAKLLPDRVMDGLFRALLG